MYCVRIELREKEVCVRIELTAKEVLCKNRTE